MKVKAASLLLVLIFSVAVKAQTEKPNDMPAYNSDFVTANGIKLHYLDWGGKGETVLFISGVGDGARYFNEMARQFTDKFRVLALTRRGYGKSDKPETGYDVATLTEDVRKFLDAMKIDKVNLIAHSAGGNELLQFASSYPKRTLRLVFLDAAYDRREIQSMEKLNPLPDPVPSATSPDLRERIEFEFFRFMDVYEPPYKKIQVPAQSYYAIFEKHWDVKPDTDEATKAKAQAFIEKVVQPYQFRNAERFRKEVKKGEVIVLRNTNHYFFEDPKQTVAVFAKIRAFLLDK
ncbi:MAG: alpha/beta hydrolase [Pyrinomonadaceae bacterium]